MSLLLLTEEISQMHSQQIDFPPHHYMSGLIQTLLLSI